MDERDLKFERAFSPFLRDERTLRLRGAATDEPASHTTQRITPHHISDAADVVDAMADEAPTKAIPSHQPDHAGTALTGRINPQQGYQMDESASTIRHRAQLRRYNVHHQDTLPVRDEHSTEAGFFLNLNALEPEESATEPSFVAALPQPTPTKPRLHMTLTYVSQRLDLSIAEAQHHGDYEEAIRLQLLQWYLQDQQMTPVEVARKAWLQSNPELK